jgi:hypothetical protein
MKLSLDTLKERAGATASMDLLATINGGTENQCHPDETPEPVKLTGYLEIDAKLIKTTPVVVPQIGVLK